MNQDGIDEYQCLSLYLDTIRHFQRKLVAKGFMRLPRHSGSGIPMKKQAKSGHGGKYTWKGPASDVEYEADLVPPAIDEKDPNYEDDYEEVGGDDEEDCYDDDDDDDEEEEKCGGAADLVV